MKPIDNFPKIFLPRRYENLEIEAQKNNLRVENIVQRVDSASTRIETLIRRVRDGGLGQFELFLGKPGSGKTTFFKTLNQFFDGVKVLFIPKEIELLEITSYITKKRSINNLTPEVWVMLDRDNLQLEQDVTSQFFEKLRMFFREIEGQIVLVWPITDDKSATNISETAWTVGRDSIVDLETKGKYSFEGLSKSQFDEVADITTRALNSGRSLATFGLSKEIVEPLIAQAETIAEFYGYLLLKSEEINRTIRDILKEKVIPRVWILVAGDDNKDLNTTVASLTQGTESKVDIDRIAAYLDNTSTGALYLKDWKRRRGQMEYLMRLFDVRLFALPPNVALAAIKAFGDDKLREEVNVKATNPANAFVSIQAARFYKLLINSNTIVYKLNSKTEEETSRQYMRIQRTSKSGDKSLNKTLADALRYSLERSKVDVEIVAEKESMDGNLKPDILIKYLEDGRIVCLEITWRSTGRKWETNNVTAEGRPTQNTLTTGHIQIYLLEKILEYVKDLGF